MFPPTSNGRRVDLRGPTAVVGEVVEEVAGAVAAMLRPPVSKARFNAAGLRARKLVGARASWNRPAVTCAFCSVLGSKPPDSTISLLYATAAAYANRSE